MADPRRFGGGACSFPLTPGPDNSNTRSDDILRFAGRASGLSVSIEGERSIFLRAGFSFAVAVASPNTYDEEGPAELSLGCRKKFKLGAGVWCKEGSVIDPLR